MDENGDPIYENNPDQNRINRYNSITKGIDAYIEDFMNLFELSDDNIMPFGDWVFLAESFLNNVNIIDKQYLSDISFSKEAIRGMNDVNIYK